MSTRNIHVNTASYTILVAGREKNTGEEWDVLEFSSLTELKKYRKSHPEKMAFSYSYALSQGVDKQFRHINIAEADHFKQFLRQIERVNSKVFFDVQYSAEIFNVERMDGIYHICYRSTTR